MKKRICALIVLALLCACWPLGVPAEAKKEENRQGDVNGDGYLNNRDLGLLQQHLNDWGVEVNLDGADLTGNGRVNNHDLGMLQQQLIGNGALDCGN